MVTVAVTPEVKGEPRVAVSPETVKKLTGLGCIVNIAAGSGLLSRFSDDAYRSAGARILDTAASAVSGADILLKVQRPTQDEVSALSAGGMAVAIMSPFDDQPGLEALAASGRALFAMEFMPRITRAQSMDVLSSQANLAGYKAVVDAASLFEQALPLMMTAAGHGACGARVRHGRWRGRLAGDRNGAPDGCHRHRDGCATSHQGTSGLARRQVHCGRG